MRGGILALLALAIGLGVGYLLGASKQVPAPARAPTQRGEPPRETRTSGDTPLARALRDLPVPQVERGTGTITGRVTRPDGTPVAGVRVRAMLSTDPGRTDGTLDLEEEVRRFAADLQRRRASAVEALTGADGGYALQGLAVAAYDISGHLAGFRVEPARNGARPGATVDFTAVPVTEVTFEVLLPDGSPAPDATIRLEAANGSSEHAWSPGTPQLGVPPGRFLCTAEHGDGEYRSDEVALDLPEGAPAPPTFLLRLKGRSGIRGTLFFSKDFPFRDACVWARPFRGEKAPDPDPALFLDEGRGHSCWTSSSEGFRYRLLDLPKGRHLAGVTLGLAIVATREVDVGEGIGKCDFVIDAIDPSLYVVVRVLDPAGKPVLDATFATGYRNDDGSSGSSSGNTMPMRADGSYLVMHEFHTHEEGGTYFIEADSPRYGKKEVSYRKEETRELVVRFLDAATLDLTIDGFGASAHSEALTVTLLPAATEADAFPGHLDGKAPDTSGHITLGPVETGEYDVTLYAGDDDAILAGTRRIRLAQGRNVLSMPMPRLYSLVVADPAGKKGQSLTLCLEGDPGWSQKRATLDGELRATFAVLPEGRYQVQREDADEAMGVVIPGPAEVVFHPTPFDALRVKVTDPAGPWGRAGLLDGDLIVAVEGDELVSAATLSFACNILSANEKTTVTILRGGRRIDLPIESRKLVVGEATGGRVEWASR